MNISRWVAAALVAGAAPMPLAAMPFADVLQRPALANSRASTAVLLSVAKAGKRLLAAGERGLILWSDDAGQRWQQARVPVSVTITALAFVDERHGYATGHGGVVLSTDDGGTTWVKRLDGLQILGMLQTVIKHPDPSGQASNYMQREAARFVEDGPDKPLLDVHFFDARNGLVVGAYGLGLSTHDGGSTWQLMDARFPNPDGKHLYKVSVGVGKVFIAGEQGALFVADQPAGPYTALSLPYTGTLYGVLALDGQRWLVHGMRGHAYLTEDAGAHWRKLDVGTTSSLSAGIRLADGRVLLVDDAGGVYLGNDKADTFTKLLISNSASLTAAVQVDDSTVLLSGARGVVRVHLK